MASSVIGNTSWSAVFRMLDVSAPSETLPATTACPLCRGRMTAYENTTSGGAWHHCRDCHKSGDTVQVAAMAWGVPTRTAIARLAEAGVYRTPAEGAAAEYEELGPGVRDRMGDLWARASAEAAKKQRPAAVAELLAAVGLLYHFDNRAAAKWLPRLVGWLPCREVTDAMVPSCHGRAAGSASAVFRGNGWKTVLMTPICRSPGYVQGFAFVGRRGRPEDRPHRTGRTLRTASAPAGLTCLWTVFEGGRPPGDRVLAVDDPWLAVRLQVRHLTTSSSPLPVVAFSDWGPYRTDASAWAAVGRRPVFWVRDGRLTASVLHQAAVSDGFLTVDPPSTKADPLAGREPRAIARDVAARGVYWKDAAAAWCRKSTEGAAETLARDFAAYGHPVETLADLSDAFSPPHTLAETRKYHLRNRGFVTEAEGRSYFHGRVPGSGGELMPCLLRIDGVERTPDNVPAYRCRLVYEGRTFPFTVPVRDTVRSMGWLREAAAGFGILVSPMFLDADGLVTYGVAAAAAEATSP